MKKFLLPVTIVVLSVSSNFAQWFPGYLIENINYNYQEATNKQMLQIDSTIYLIRHGGLEAININDFTIQNNWSDYQIRKIVADTSHTFVYLKDYNVIGRYNQSTGIYEDIWPDEYSNKYLTDIDVASDGKIWALTSGLVKEVVVWNGNSWQFFSYEAYGYGYGSTIQCMNSNNAIILTGYLFLQFQNGSFDTVYYNSDYPVIDWDVDEAGNLWAAAGNLWPATGSVLIHSFNGNTVILDSASIPIGNDELLHIKLGSNGHVWTAGNSNHVYELAGTSWEVHQISPYNLDIENFTLNEQDLPWIVTHSYGIRKLLEPSGNNWTDHIIPFMPVNNPRAIGIKTYYSNTGYFATEGGYFSINLVNMALNNFIDTTMQPYANEITCFTENDPQDNYAISYGTHHGAYGIQGFDNSQLPSQNVNFICQYYGTYYIATDSGLTAFNGIFYNHFNTSNSPLPSNKITFVTTNYTSCFWFNGNNGLYIGTDKGVAVYRNAQWTVYDTSNINIDNFYVTGILPYCYNDDIYVATLGNGLVRIFMDGEYELYNTINGNFEDDTLYYVKFMELAECGAFIVAGTSHHGIGYSDAWDPENFEFETQYEFSKSAAIGHYYAMNILSTDQSFMILTPCGSIGESSMVTQLSWYQQSDNLIIKIPSEYNGDRFYELTDMTGRVILSNQLQINSDRVTMNVGNLSRGIYIFSINNGIRKGYCKVLLTK